MKEKEKKGDFKIPEEALEKIKSQSELDDFFSDLCKQALEDMLKAELDEHLGYEKHRTREMPGDNNRNGFSKKTAASSYCETAVCHLCMQSVGGPTVKNWFGGPM